jgi:hypothetical protein
LRVCRKREKSSNWKEAIMKIRCFNTILAAIGVLAFCVAIAGTSIATQGEDVNGHSATAIGHLLLPGAPVTQMLLQRQQGKLYLYVEQGQHANVAIIDVTNPSRPTLIQHVTWPSRVANAELRPLGSELALSESPESQAVSRGTINRPQKVNILDMADPAHPQVLETFDGVTSVLPQSDLHRESTRTLDRSTPCRAVGILDAAPMRVRSSVAA